MFFHLGSPQVKWKENLCPSFKVCHRKWLMCLSLVKRFLRKAFKMSFWKGSKVCLGTVEQNHETTSRVLFVWVQMFHEIFLRYFCM